MEGGAFLRDIWMRINASEIIPPGIGAARRLKSLKQEYTAERIAFLPAKDLKVLATNLLQTASVLDASFGSLLATYFFVPKEFKRLQAKANANERLRRDPKQVEKREMNAEWKRWQHDRSLYKYPRDYRKAMLNRFPTTVDGSLKNWMSRWAKEQKKSRS